MFNKIYLVVLLLAILAMSAMTYVPLSWLDRTGFSPQIINDTFDWWDNASKMTLWISSLVLLILANIILWSNRKAWALWTTFLFFAVFVLLNSLWLSDKVNSYQLANNLPQSGFILKGLTGAIFVVLAGVGVYLNQFVVTKMRDKIHGAPNENVVETVEEKIESKTDN